MNKEARLAYMRKRFPQLEEERCETVVQVSEVEVTEEVNQLDTFGEHQEIVQENVINNDER